MRVALSSREGGRGARGAPMPRVTSSRQGRVMNESVGMRMAQCQCLPHALGSGEGCPDVCAAAGLRKAVLVSQACQLFSLGRVCLCGRRIWCVHSPSGGGWCRLERGAGRASRFVAVALCAVSAYQGRTAVCSGGPAASRGVRLRRGMWVGLDRVEGSGAASRYRM